MAESVELGGVLLSLCSPGCNTVYYFNKECSYNRDLDSVLLWGCVLYGFLFACM